MIDVYDDCQLYVNGKCIAWATYDEHEYYGMAKALPDMLYSLADTLGFEAFWLSVDFPETDDGEEHPLAMDWVWSDVYDFIITGKYQEEV